MSDERLMKVLLGPHISEKTTLVAEQANQIVFKVMPDATKPEIKKAVEMLFDVRLIMSRSVMFTARSSVRARKWANVRAGKRHMFVSRQARISISWVQNNELTEEDHGIN